MTPEIASPITRIEDFTQTQLRRFVERQCVSDTEAQELCVLFLQLGEFAEEVYAGGAWPHERVWIMLERYRNLLERNPVLPVDTQQ